MSKKKKKKATAKAKVKDKITFLDIYKKVRKPMPPATKVINPKKYDRKDKSWMDENEE